MTREISDTLLDTIASTGRAWPAGCLDGFCRFPDNKATDRGGIV